MAAEHPAATTRAFAEHVVAEIDTYGDPRIYRLAEDYLAALALLQRTPLKRGVVALVEEVESLASTIPAEQREEFAAERASVISARRHAERALGDDFQGGPSYGWHGGPS